MPLSISFNIRKIEGPYGGGNAFVNYLQAYLEERGHKVCRHLEPGLDLVLVVSASPNPATTSYGLDEILEYRRLHPKVAVMHRVNMSDEARGVEQGLNKAILSIAAAADHVVFVSEFIKRHFQGHGLDPLLPSSIIRTGADERIFHAEGGEQWSPEKPMKLITHHWSAGLLKGSDIYLRLDEMLSKPPYAGRFEFTYVGNLPFGMSLCNSRHVKTVHPKDVGGLLRSHHAYVSAARFEAAGNHFIEAVQCGLPVAYLNSGSLPEYCGSCGVEFTLDSFQGALEALRENYADLRAKALARPYPASLMAERYEALMLEVVESRRRLPIAPPSLATRAELLAKSLRRRAGRARRYVCKRICG